MLDYQVWVDLLLHPAAFTDELPLAVVRLYLPSGIVLAAEFAELPLPLPEWQPFLPLLSSQALPAPINKYSG